MSQGQGSKEPGIGTARGRLVMPVIGLAAGLALILLALTMFMYAQVFAPGNAAGGEVTFAHGTSVKAMSRELASKGVIRSALVFRTVAKIRGHASRLQAGTYAFAKGASMIDVLNQIEQGRVVRNVVTIPEGKTSAQAIRILNAAPYLSGDVEVPPEGSILPETYQYERGENRQAVLDRMLEAGRKTIDQLWATRASGLPIATKEDAIIMASIVERETGKASERPRVAAVFLNRLKEGIRLGSDPTVIYGVSHGEPLGRGLTRAELDTWSPWNTYLIDKLPVTPIANPGKASLAAVLNPAKTNDLYFVADGTGGHVFSATYEEHLANVAHWRQIEGQVSHYTSSAQSDEGAASPQTQSAAMTAPASDGVRLKASAK